jgi:cyclopropane-fatty-acyl-phospholipid synthase
MVPLTKRRSVQSAAAETSLAALRLLFGKAFVRDFGVRLWDGTRVPSEGNETFVFRVNAPGALRTALAKPTDLAAGRAFVGTLIEIEGDMESAVDALMRATSSLGLLRALRLMHLLRKLPESRLPELREAHLRGRLHSRERDSAAIAFHYDHPVDFYRTFLGPQLMYSCAYFDDGIDAIDNAQNAKIDYILRKVRLRPGERLLDIGCGWGSLIMRATSRFGARATGITLSQSQYDEARRRISEDGNAAEIYLRDYRDLEDGKFDKIVSIGMFEHVGRGKLREYFNTAFRALRPGACFSIRVSQVRIPPTVAAKRQTSSAGSSSPTAN